MILILNSHMDLISDMCVCLGVFVRCAHARVRVFTFVCLHIENSKTTLSSLLLSAPFICVVDLKVGVFDTFVAFSFFTVMHGYLAYYTHCVLCIDWLVSWLVSNLRYYGGS